MHNGIARTQQSAHCASLGKRKEKFQQGEENDDAVCMCVSGTSRGCVKSQVNDLTNDLFTQSRADTGA